MADSDLKSAAVLLGRKGGSATTDAKQAAARENGKKGGRPRKLPASPPRPPSEFQNPE